MEEIKFRIHQTGEVVTVSSVSYDEYETFFGKKSAIPLLMACGFVTAYTTDEMLAKMHEHFAGNDVALAAMGNTKAGHSVTILSDIDNLLCYEDGQAIFLHEIGHVIYDHIKDAVTCETTMPTLDAGGVQLLNSEEIEIEADAYAASVVGYHRVICALNSAVRAMAQVAAQKSTKGIPASVFEDATMAALKSSLRYQELLKYTEGY